MSGSLLLQAEAHGSGGATPRAAREGAAASVSLLPERGRIVWSGLSNVGQAVKDKQRASGGERATSGGEVMGQTPDIYHYRKKQCVLGCRAMLLSKLTLSSEHRVFFYN